ncbi:MAG: ATP synthase F1 subunit delta [Eubacteriaceae bacterium]
MSLVSKKYASALMDVAKENANLDEVYEQFKIVIDELTTDKRIWMLLNIPSMDTKMRKNLISDIFKNSLNQYLYNFIMILFDKNRFNELKFIFLSFKELYLMEKNMIEVTVVSVLELSESQKNTLKVKLEKQYNKIVILHNKIDKTILGGLIIYVGEKVIDGSIKSKLMNLRNDLKEIRLQELGVS